MTVFNWGIGEWIYSGKHNYIKFIHMFLRHIVSGWLIFLSIDKYIEVISLCSSRTTMKHKSPYESLPVGTSMTSLQIKVRTTIYKSEPQFTSPNHNLQVRTIIYKSEPQITIPNHKLQARTTNNNLPQ